MPRLIPADALALAFYIATTLLLIGLHVLPGRWGKARRVTALASIMTAGVAGYFLIASHKATAHAPEGFVDNQRSGSGTRGFVARGGRRAVHRSSRSSRGSGQYRSQRRPSFADRSSGRAIMAEGSGPARVSGSQPESGGPGHMLASLFNSDQAAVLAARIQDCPDCPEMVVVPAAYFPIGAGPHDAAAQPSERPQRTGRIGRPFAIGILEVTVAQYRAFVKATGHRVPNCEGFDFSAAAARQPVQCVSHMDAQAYVRWLGSVSSESYRLPSAAEWEHAARAGTGTRYWSGNVLEPGMHAISMAEGRPPDAGSHPANGFGLRDVIGSVAEIVDDCFDTTLRDAPTDGTAARTWLCLQRVLKDAAWNELEQRARASARRAIHSDATRRGVGFRVARTVR